MWNEKVRFVDGIPAEKQDIHIQGAGAEPALRIAYPPGIRLDGLEGGQKTPGGPNRLQIQSHDLVGVIRLVRVPPGFGLIDWAFENQPGLRERGQALPSQTQMGEPVSQVGTETAKSPYSLAMRASASSIRATGTVMAMRK